MVRSTYSLPGSRRSSRASPRGPPSTPFPEAGLSRTPSRQRVGTSSPTASPALRPRSLMPWLLTTESLSPQVRSRRSVREISMDETSLRRQSMTSTSSAPTVNSSLRRDRTWLCKRYHFLEGPATYREGQEIMWETSTRKIVKRYTPFADERLRPAHWTERSSTFRVAGSSSPMDPPSCESSTGNGIHLRRKVSVLGARTCCG